MMLWIYQDEGTTKICLSRREDPTRRRDASESIPVFLCYSDDRPHDRPMTLLTIGERGGSHEAEHIPL